MSLPRVTLDELGITPGFTVRQYMLPGEEDILLALIDRVQPLAMVEVGVNLGLTARAVLQNIGSIQQYVGIDVPSDYQFEIPAQSSERPADPGHLVRDDPRFEMVWRNGNIIPLRYPCGVLFIDGDHGYHSVLRDSAIAADLVVPGGLIIYHDYGNASVQVTRALDDLQATGRDIRHVESTWLAFEPR